NVFAEYDTQRAMLGFTIPAPWFQSINPVCILLFAPPLAWLWTHLGTRQPPTPVKFATALFLVAGSMAMMVVASRFAPLSGEATLSGELAGLYGTVGVAAYYGLLALLMLATGATIAVLTPWLLREMEGVR